MEFFLDTLYIGLVMLCVYLLVVLIRTRIKAKKALQTQFAVLLPHDLEQVKQGVLHIKYELPEDSLVTILLSENGIEKELLNEQQTAGNYQLKQEINKHLALSYSFVGGNIKVNRKINS